MILAATNFTWIDAFVVVAYLAMLVLIGVYFSRRQKGIESFFLAGRGMSWLPIGLSLMAALNSGIDYVAGPSSVFKYSLIFTIGIFSWIFLYPWVSYVSLPFFRRLQTVSAYEYLERRFNVAVRTLGSCIFLLWRIGWMGTALYVPCLAIETITGGALNKVYLIIAVGIVVTVYTMLGGIEAVIWTDVIQFCIMLTGVVVALGVVLSNVDGGFSAVWEISAREGRTAFSFPVKIPENASLWDSIVGYFSIPTAMSAILITTVVGRMAGYTSDQVMIQRFQTTKSLKDSRNAFIINAVGDAIWTVGLALVGLALFAYYQMHDTLPAEYRENTDKVFPHFMATVFPTGVIGLVVAAILAASLSSIDSAINSCTSIIIIDFYNRLYLRRQVVAPARQSGEAKHDDSSDPGQAQQLLVSRIATVCIGVVGIAIAANVSRIGIVLQIGAKVIQTFTGPILGIYLLGMFTKRTNSIGVLIGGVLGTALALFVAFGQTRAFGSEIICFIWPTVFGLVGTLIFGYLASLLAPGSVSAEQQQLTWRNVMKQPLPESSELGRRSEPEAAAVAS